MVPPDLRPGHSPGNPDAVRSYEDIVDRQLVECLEKLDLAMTAMPHWPSRIGFIRNNGKIAAALNVSTDTMSFLFTDVRDRGVMDDILFPRSPYDQRTVACFDKERLRAFGALVFSLSKTLPSPTGQPLRIDPKNRQTIPWDKVVMQAQEALGNDSLKSLLHAPLDIEELQKKSREEITEYSLVENPDLRSYLEQFEQVMLKEVKMWPVRSESLATNRKITEFLRLSTSAAGSFFGQIFGYRIVKPLKLSAASYDGKVLGLTKNGVRAVAALTWSAAKRVPLSQNGTLLLPYNNFDITQLNEMVLEVKAALGQHPLINMINIGTTNDSEDRGENTSMIATVVYSKDNTGATAKGKTVIDRIPQLTVEELQILGRFDYANVFSLCSKFLPAPVVYSNAANIQKIIPPYLAQVFLYVEAFSESVRQNNMIWLEGFDVDRLNGITLDKLHHAIFTTSKYMQSFPALDSLAKLFKAIKIKVQDDFEKKNRR